MLFLEAIEKHLPEDWPIMIGLDGNCVVCQAIVGRPSDEFTVVDLRDGAWDGYETFGRCATCGNVGHKIKHAAHTADEEGDLFHLDICEVCLIYFVHHEEPKEWKKKWR